MPEPTPRPPAAPPGKAANDTYTQASMDTREPAPLGPGGPPFPFLGPPAADGDLGTLGGYRVVKLLGEGGMGFVFRAEDDQLRRPVAMKVMRPEVAAGPVAKDRFLREGRAAAGLKSDHVVTIYQVGEANGVPFLAMEYLDGAALDDWLKARPGPASVGAVLRVARDVLKGLAAAHAKGLVHRDIKPANLWVEAGANRVKVLDFGLTRDAAGADQFTKEGAIVGTPAYMAPEQANGQPVDGRADLFSVGVVLYRMLAGKSPFQRDTLFATIAALATETPPSVETLVGGVPGEVGWFINRLLAKNPADRPADARAALTELQEVERAVKAAAAAAPLVSTTQAVPVADPWEGIVSAAPDARPGPVGRPGHGTGEAHPPRDRGGPPKPLLLAGGVVAAVAVVAAAAFVLTRGKPPEPTTPEVAEATRPARPTAKATPKTAAKEPADPDRAAAETLAPFANLAVRTATGQEMTVRPGDPLPSGAFTLSGIEFPPGENLPPDFATATLLPALDGLRDLTALRCLSRRVNVSDRDAPRLLAHPSVAGLRTFQTCMNLTPATLDSMGRMPNLTSLSVHASKADDALLLRLTELPRLDSLGLVSVGESGRVTAAGYEAITARPVRTLRLTGVSTTGDPDLFRRVARMPLLEDLSLYDAVRVGDAAAGELAACPKLVRLNVMKTGVTAAGVRTLAAALPRCRIEWSGGVVEPTAAPPPAVAPYDAAAARRHQEAWAAHLGQKVAEPNAVGMDMVLLPPGEFRMGTAPGEPGAQTGDQPQHTVRLTRPLRVGKTEVTVGEFRAFVTATGYKTEAETGEGTEVPNATGIVRDPKLTWRSPQYPVAESLPVAAVGRADAAAFCAWLSKKDGKTYRLPTEAEWEYACRAGTATPFYTGDTITPAQANFGAGGPVEVGRYPANPFGLHDMVGNVYEWCGDGRRDYTPDPAVDPVGTGAGTGVVRGGGWTTGMNLSWLRSAKRFLIPRPVYYAHGFRVVCEVGPAAVSSLPPLDPAWVAKVKAMPPDDQVKEVAAELKRRNPEFDPAGLTVEFSPAPNRRVTSALIRSAVVADVSPVRAWDALTAFCVKAPFERPGVFTHLGPLRGLPLTAVWVEYCPLDDIGTLAGMPLRKLHLVGTRVADLGPLRGMKLEYLNLCASRVTDLSPVAGMPLKAVYLHEMLGRDVDYRHLAGCPVEAMDVTPGHLSADEWAALARLPLKSLGLSSTYSQARDGDRLKELIARCPTLTEVGSNLLPSPVGDANADGLRAVLRASPKITRINGKPAAEFWKDVDAKKP